MNVGYLCIVTVIKNACIIPGNTEIKENDLGGYKFGAEVEVTIGEGDTILSELLDKVNSYI